jgi:TPR repeat protein
MIMISRKIVATLGNAAILLVLLSNTAWAQSSSEGVSASNESDYVTVFEVSLPLAEQGNVNAQFSVGYLYKNGKGVTQDYSEAVRWFRAAAEQGHTEAQVNLGTMYVRGDGVKQNDSEGVRWFQAAAEQGHTVAEYKLGLAYSLGRGVVQDHSKSFRWHRAAAEKGYAAAQTSIGFKYLLGEGVIQDNIAAHKWFNIASANDDQAGREERDRLADRMSREAIEEAQNRARTCVESGYQDCD